MTYTSKRRNSEKRKEKSRDAARSRRGKEAEIFTDLAAYLPLPESAVSQLDKASIMRMVISILRINKIMLQREAQAGTKMEVEDMKSMEKKIESMYPKAVEGFFIIISKDGDIIYVTESIAKYLGLQQIDLMGQSIYEFAHPCDHNEIGDMLTTQQVSGTDPSVDKRDAFIRLKCTLTNKGRIVNLKSATYKVIRFSGVYVSEGETVVMKEEVKDIDEDLDEEELEAREEPCFLPYLLAVGEPIPHPSNIEVPLDVSTFTSRHSMNMKFTDCDDRIRQLIGYRHQELLGKSLYLYHHAQDSKVLEKAFKDLFTKGQTTTGLYRFLAKNGGYVWMITQATIIYHTRTQKAQCIVCVHYVISQVEEAGNIMSNVQLPTSVGDEKPFMPVQNNQTQRATAKPIKQAPKKVHPDPEEIYDVPPVQFSTEDVFAQRTEDMDGDFYFPPGMKQENKNRPDLNHLAPKDSDISIPLGPHLTTKMNKVESYGTSLNLYDDFAELETKDQLLKMDFLLPPFKEDPANRQDRMKCYRDTKQIMSTSPSPVSSPRFSPGPQVVPSPSSSLDVNNMELNNMDRFFTKMNTDVMGEKNVDAGEIDFSMRAPYIPMSADDDFSLMPPTNEALFNLGGDFNPGLFGRTESVFGPKDKLFEDVPPVYQPSVRDMLCESPAVASIEQPHNTLILQMKRPLDKNSLEKGPPPAKKARGQAQTNSRKESGNSSVLKNLLMTGEDKNHGYKVKQDISGESSRRRNLLHSLLEVTNKECEVNAPIRENKRLLHGQDLVRALDLGTGVAG